MISISKKTIGWAVGVSLVSLATVAVAGEAITGYGSTRAAAADQANQYAKQASFNRFKRGDCYTPVRPQDCRKDQDEWICVAYVANHEGSCGF